MANTGQTPALEMRGQHLLVSSITVEGTGIAGNVVLTTPQSLTSAQQAQARANLGVSIELDVSGSGAATANTALLQAALNTGGRIVVKGAGTAYINSRLIINSSTDLRLSPLLTLRQASGSNNSMLRNAASLSTPSSASISWSSGMNATITWTAHGLVAGDSVWLLGSDQQEYLGVFPVLSVTDANTVVVLLRLQPTTASTGTITAVKADRDISISGGMWNYDYINNPGSSLLGKHALVLVGVSDLSIDTSVRDALKYCCNVSAVRNWKVKLTIPQTNSDGLKIYGPAFDGEIVALDASVGDDLVSFQPMEATAFLANASSFGPIIGVKGGNINCRKQATGGQGAVVFYTHKTYILRDVALSGVYGNSAMGGVVLTTSGDLVSTEVGLWGNLSVTDVGITSKCPWEVRGLVAGTTISGDSLTIGVNEAVFNGDTASNVNGSLIWISDYLIANSVLINIKTTRASYGSGGGVYALFNNGHIRNCIVTPYIADNASLRFIRVDSSSTSHYIDRMEVHGGYVSTDHLITMTAGTVNLSTPEFILNGVRTDGLSGIVPNVSCNITVIGCEFNNMSNGIFRNASSATPAVIIKAYGNRLLGSSVWIVVPSGTPTVSPQSMEISGDVSASWIVRATGNLMKNTNAAAGTLAADGPVICQGTAANSWKLMSDPTKAY